MATTVRLHDDTVEDLYDLKKRGESYDDVVKRLLETQRSTNKEPETENGSA